MKNIISKLQDWYDRAYYTITHISVRRFWSNIGRWLSYYPICRKIYDFDYDSILAVERHQIERVRDSIIYYHNHLNWERDVAEMNLALHLLGIVEEDGCSERVGKPMEFEQCEDNEELYRLVPDPDKYWTLPVYVNTRNSKRFSKMDPERYDDPKCGNLWKDHLRVQKAWYLYNKLRHQYLQGWWD